MEVSKNGLLFLELAMVGSPGGHVNFYDEYDFSEKKLQDSIGFNLPEIDGWEMEEKREQRIPLKSIK